MLFESEPKMLFFINSILKHLPMLIQNNFVLFQKSFGWRMCPQLCNEHWIWNTVVFGSQPTIVLTVHTSEKSAICSNNTNSYSSSHCDTVYVYEPVFAYYEQKRSSGTYLRRNSKLVCEMCVGIFNAEDRVNWNAFVRFAPLEWFGMRYFTERCVGRALNQFQSLIFFILAKRDTKNRSDLRFVWAEKTKIKKEKLKFQWKIYLINLANGCKFHFIPINDLASIYITYYSQSTHFNVFIAFVIIIKKEIFFFYIFVR